MADYPYIQKKTYSPKGVCQVCNTEGKCLNLEWRVDIFQGNCEFEKLCFDCAHKRGYNFTIEHNKVKFVRNLSPSR